LKYNVNINEIDKNGRTALDYAIAASKGDVISYLRARNARVSFQKNK
jgi:ankyrin repeat protein